MNISHFTLPEIGAFTAGLCFNVELYTGFPTAEGANRPLQFRSVPQFSRLSNQQLRASRVLPEMRQKKKNPAALAKLTGLKANQPDLHIEINTTNPIFDKDETS